MKCAPGVFGGPAEDGMPATCSIRHPHVQLCEPCLLLLSEAVESVGRADEKLAVADHDRGTRRFGVRKLIAREHLEFFRAHFADHQSAFFADGVDLAVSDGRRATDHFPVSERGLPDFFAFLRVEAGDHLFVTIEQVEAAVVIRGRANVGRLLLVEGPLDAAGGDVAFHAGAEGNGQFLFRAADERDLAVGRGRRHEALEAAFVAIEPVAAPDFLAALRGEGGEAIAAREKELRFAADREGHQGRIGFHALKRGRAGEDMLPQRFAIRGIDCEDIAFAVPTMARDAGIIFRRGAALQNRHVELAVVKEWRTAVDPVDGKLTVIRAEISRPELFPLEIESREIPRAEEHINRLAIGNGRRAGHVASAFGDVATAYRFFPAHAAILTVDAIE